MDDTFFKLLGWELNQNQFVVVITCLVLDLVLFPVSLILLKRYWKHRKCDFIYKRRPKHVMLANVIAIYFIASWVHTLYFVYFIVEDAVQIEIILFVCC